MPPPSPVKCHRNGCTPYNEYNKVARNPLTWCLHMDFSTIVTSE
ncbi:hypothetical protein C5167_024085 [Papaver somniferum]|uniref:Uncharacterized protein n=1 Tax=Papaver somniferum TaxID=3469 RepID=A0A4Y7JQW4_PAPSO|nr:hypothetical protein C5167_024085 [Papaver somniferum]